MEAEPTGEPRSDVVLQDAPPPSRDARLRTWLRAGHPRDPRTVRRAAYLLYVVVVVAIVIVSGVPEKRGVLIALILVLLAITCIGRGRRALLRMLLDWLPFAAVLLIYDQSRRLGDKLGMPLHESDVAHAEKALFGGEVPTVWLQHHLYTVGQVHWYDAACTLVYTSHFLATPVLAAVLWLTARDAWLRYITRVVTLSLAGLVTYCLFPEAPPWLAAKNGVIEPVSRLSAQGWVYLHAGNIKSLLARAQDEGSNPVAAMPSVHTALAVLVAIAIASRIRSRWRWLLVLYPLAMGFTLVYDGEHYVLDLVAGAVYALAVHVLIGRWESRRAARGLGPYDFVPASLAGDAAPDSPDTSGTVRSSAAS